MQGYEYGTFDSSALLDFFRNSQRLKALGYVVSDQEIEGQKHPLQIIERSEKIKGVKQSEPAKTILISAGVHGDEPAGSLALARLLLKDGLPRDANLIIMPLINPDGMDCCTRNNPDGVDLNRDFNNSKSAVAKAIKAYLKTKSIDLHLDLHEDWEYQGFYFYDFNLIETSVSTQVVDGTLKSIETKSFQTTRIIDGKFRVEDGVINLSGEPDSHFGQDYPFALYTQLNGACSYVFETPSNAFTTNERVQTMCKTVSAAVDSFMAFGHFR